MILCEVLLFSSGQTMSLESLPVMNFTQCDPSTKSIFNLFQILEIGRFRKAQYECVCTNFQQMEYEEC